LKTFLIFVLLCIFPLAMPSFAQQPSPREVLPTVVFHFESHAQPVVYEMVVTRDGAMHYSYTEKPADDDADPVEEAKDLFLRQSTVTKIFELAKQARYFDGDFDYHEHRVADTGAKTLSYTGGGEHHSTTYNWSQNTAIDQLTRIFQGIAATLDSGRRLESMRRYDKLGVNAELAALTQRYSGGAAVEIYLIEPTLRMIASDASIMQSARSQAGRLLQLAEQGK